jgi:hypothetical protein
MLQIRPAQLAAIEETMWQALTTRLAKAIRDGHPQWVAALDPAEADARVAEAVQRARGFGLASEASVAHFVKLSFLFGRRFADHPHVRACLTNESQPADDRMQTLLATTPQEVWAEIAGVTAAPRPPGPLA